MDTKTAGRERSRRNRATGANLRAETRRSLFPAHARSHHDALLAARVGGGRLRRRVRMRVRVRMARRPRMRHDHHPWPRRSIGLGLGMRDHHDGSLRHRRAVRTRLCAAGVRERPSSQPLSPAAKGRRSLITLAHDAELDQALDLASATHGLIRELVDHRANEQLFGRAPNGFSRRDRELFRLREACRRRGRPTQELPQRIHSHAHGVDLQR